MKTLILVLVVSLLTACASTHPGNMATVAKGPHQPILISAQDQSDFSDDYHTFVTFTVENKSEDWARIKDTDIDFVGSDRGLAVIVGEDLISWAAANEEAVKKAAHNNKLAQTGLMLGGLILGGVGRAANNGGLAMIGMGAAAGGVVWTASSSIRTQIKKAENPKQVPSQHIYARYSVPAGKFLRKWAVIKHPKNYVLKKLFLTVELADGTETKYAIKIN